MIIRRQMCEPGEGSRRDRLRPTFASAPFSPTNPRKEGLPSSVRRAAAKLGPVLLAQAKDRVERSADGAPGAGVRRVQGVARRELSNVG